MAGRAHLHLVLPHQLFEEQLGAPQGARFVLIGHDLMFRQHAFPLLDHELLTSSLNTELLNPAEVVTAVLGVAEDREIPIAFLEGLIRQIIGWRECLRATYHLCGRRLRTGNHLGHGPDLGRGWWQASTGLDPLDLPAAVGRQGRRRPPPPAGAGRAAAELMRTELLSF